MKSNEKKRKTESNHRAYILLKINSKSIIDLNVKHKTVKLKEDYMGENFDGLEYKGDS